VPDFTWAAQAGRFRDPATGRFVSESTVRSGVDALVQDSAGRMAGLARQLRAGELTTADWLAAQMQAIKDVNLAAAMAAKGGAAQMTPADYGQVGHDIRRQYEYARQMAADVLNGRQPLNGRLNVRASQYANNATIVYERDKRAQAARRGGRFERNQQHSLESCSGCRAQTGRGWVPVGSLVPVGSRSPCGSRCKCSITIVTRVPELAVA
jgi:hypothetical protein